MGQGHRGLELCASSGSCVGAWVPPESRGSFGVNRIITLLLLVAAVFLLTVSISGFIRDAEISSTRFGSDFNDSRYHHPDAASYGRAEQVSRRTVLGLEAVGGLGLFFAGMVLHAPKQREVILRDHREAREPAAPETVTNAGLRDPGRFVVMEGVLPKRRRPDASKFVKKG